MHDQKENTIAPVRNEQAGIMHFVAVKQDVTERERIAAALRQSEEEFRAMFDVASVGMAQADPRTGKWLRVNQRMCAITGYSVEELLQMRVPELTHPEDRPRDWELFERVVRGEAQDYRLDKRYLRKDGSVAWVNMNMTVIRNAGGQIIRTIAAIEDITERKLAQQALAQSEERFRTLFELAPDGIYLCDLQGRFVDGNKAAEELVGYAKTELIGKSFLTLHLLSESDLLKAAAALARNVQREATGPEEYALNRKDGRQVPVEIRTFPVRIQGKALVLGVARDITERKRAQEELCASEVRYRRLFEAAKDGVLILDAETGMVVDVNPFLVQLLGFPREAFLEKKVWELGFFKDIVANQANFETLRQKEYIRFEDKPLETADGRRIDVEFVSNVYQVDRQKVIQCNIRDITTRKLTEWRALIYKDQLRALSARIEAMREEERTRIAREIHDELGQMLTGIKMDLCWMEHRLDEFGEDRRVNPILDKLVATAELTDATVKAVQRIAAELRPGILDNLGLPMALQYEAARFQEHTGIACRLVVPEDSLALPAEAATAFFRIFQEALTNVTRHAKATAVEAELTLEAEGCRLEVRDNGQGMAGVDLANLKSLGLLGMEERAALLGGSVAFAPRPGGGTMVTVRIPNSPA